jgi:predicted O-methyltransferase YrrM
MIVEMIKPKNILEIGTFTGYSAICLAEGLDEDGKLYTFDVNDELEDFTRKWIEGSPVADKICYKIGSALDEAPALGVTFDLVFIDGDKREYIEYYQMAMDILRTGGWIIADNTLWDGHVIEPDRRDAQTERVRRFNELIGKDNRVEKVILPLRDGLTIIRKIE